MTDKGKRTEEDELFPFLKNTNDDDLLQENENHEGTLWQDTPLPSADEILSEVRSTGTCLNIWVTADSEDVGSETIFNISAKAEIHKELLQVSVQGKEIDKLFLLLKKYGEIMNENCRISPENDKSGIQLAFMPEKYYGHIFLGCTDPIFWALTAEDIGKTVDQISMAFLPDNVGIFTVTENKADNNEH